CARDQGAAALGKYYFDYW
nr:immunoglobulin heavy chain junction region [Macaca mulatta]MOX14825.1 immunoglobulin heavy chain junction region [Macaca mulatta]MOX14948.1 immunoglobulin heavy chain junction region [Macaca mulatta]MOX15651.1 immunoglobulin heavy chain junction region [Macaca mulatta]